MTFTPDMLARVVALKQHAATPGASRKVWQLTRTDDRVADEVWGTRGPTLNVGIGAGVGVLAWTDDSGSYIATGGGNSEPVTYEWAEFDDAIFPPGSELPVDVVLSVVDQYALAFGRPDGVRWSAGRPAHRIARTGAR